MAAFEDRTYYTLVASLPALPYFETAERLPINRDRLEQRLTMLLPEDRETVHLAEAFLTWQRRRPERSDAAFVEEYRRSAFRFRSRPLREMIDERLQVRTVVAALRRRALGQGPPERGRPWGIGPHVLRIERHWHEPDFGLRHVHPWLPGLRERLEAGDALGVERRLMALVWAGLRRAAEGQAFGFVAVLAYLFQWDIVRRWLSYNADAAEARLERLTGEAVGEYGALLA
jgi:hypothetical protein